MLGKETFMMPKEIIITLFPFYIHMNWQARIVCSPLTTSCLCPVCIAFPMEGGGDVGFQGLGWGNADIIGSWH